MKFDDVKKGEKKNIHKSLLWISYLNDSVTKFAFQIILFKSVTCLTHDWGHDPSHELMYKYINFGLSLGDQTQLSCRKFVKAVSGEVSLLHIPR